MINLRLENSNVNIERDWRSECVLRWHFDSVGNGQFKPPKYGVHLNGRAN